ncbi:MAG: hypothetical protein US40_C0016G0005 [Candidatus Roizmanbacteria bacterium GW2011_GWC2_37_13]|uniref:Uncharacterized protein n=1 Tax=Candidatus Roizmanbacteria bacterium GW2011_GWC2_37_13 TaxID=1618486 RepID=A0A0G0FZR6_9BACT|nr:MAG: hypothetical protein US38_C0017G0002 [Candidatus Roizmanbacteria bacterium GW2011_GWC1_37_12]KKQ24443.1 MAG: hypothetical protein US40_C0016G0005 [Candidatus Roizmanbacteria bacterium GW2011_GWC2_37_13]
MKKIIFSQKPKADFLKNKPAYGDDFISFVADQFKRLTKKNLRVPIQLYHL